MYSLLHSGEKGTVVTEELTRGAHHRVSFLATRRRLSHTHTLTFMHSHVSLTHAERGREFFSGMPCFTCWNLEAQRENRRSYKCYFEDLVVLKNEDLLTCRLLFWLWIRRSSFYRENCTDELWKHGEQVWRDYQWPYSQNFLRLKVSPSD